MLSLCDYFKYGAKYKLLITIQTEVFAFSLIVVSLKANIKRIHF